MTKEEQIELYNNANASKKDLIEEINCHINKYKWFIPQFNLRLLSPKMRQFCTKNNLLVLETNRFSNKIPNKLKTYSYYTYPTNDIYVVLDSNKIKHICCIRSGGLPTLLDVGTKITLPTVKLIYKAFVLDGFDVNGYIKFIKKTKIDAVNFSEKYKDKLIVSAVSGDSVQLKKLKKITFYPQEIKLTIEYEPYSFLKNTGQLQRLTSLCYERATSCDAITQYFTVHSNDKIMSKDTLIASVLEWHETKVKQLETELQKSLDEIESHYAIATDNS